MKIKFLDRHTVVMIAADLDAVVKAEADEYGLTAVRKGSVRYDNGTMTIKFEIAVPEVKETRTKSKNDHGAERLGLPKDIIGTWFNSPTPTGRDRWFKVTEINLRRHRYPISAVSERGTSYKFTADSVKRCLPTRKKK